MHKPKNWRCFSLMAIVLAIGANFLLSASAYADVDGEGGFTPGGVSGVVREVDPGTGNLVPIAVGTPDSIYGFFFRPVCFDETGGDIGCLAEQSAECDAGPDGQYVWWYSGLLTEDRETWKRYGDSPTCVYSADAQELGEELVGLVLREFQTRPINPGRFVLQPSPHTLVNMHTNLYAEAAVQTFDMVLLGQNIKIQASPTEYEWNYGDGTIYGPSPNAGAPLAVDRLGEVTETSHVFGNPGEYVVSVSVYFSGKYSINGGPMIPIDGRAMASAPMQLLNVWRSESRNVADDCNVSPSSFGC